MRQNHGQSVAIDTCHAAFGLMEDYLHGTAPALLTFDLIVIDEVNQMEARHTDQIIKLWNVADRLSLIHI
eukprot:165637-Prorocentrum_lima.AAC.1